MISDQNRLAYNVNHANFKVDHLHNQMFSTVHGCSHGSDKDYWIKQW